MAAILVTVGAAEELKLSRSERRVVVRSAGLSVAAALAIAAMVLAAFVIGQLGIVGTRASGPHYIEVPHYIIKKEIITRIVIRKVVIIQNGLLRHHRLCRGQVVPVKATDILTVAITIITPLVVAAGGVGTWAALRVGKNTGVVTKFKDAADASEALATSLKAKSDDQQSQIQDLQRQLSDRDREIKVLQGQMEILRDLVTGRPSWEDLSHKIENLIGRVDSRMGETLLQVDEVRTGVKEVQESVEAIAVGLTRIGGPGGGRRRNPPGDSTKHSA